MYVFCVLIKVVTLNELQACNVCYKALCIQMNHMCEFVLNVMAPLNDLHACIVGQTA